MNFREILEDKDHRPWEMPNGRWKYYQEWNDALFLHWQLDPDVLRGLVPHPLAIDLFEGKAWVSLVAFTMQKIRPRNLPAVSFVSDFHEVNIRTYVEKDGKQGVYFLNIEGGKILSVLLSKRLSGLPYEKSSILRTSGTYVSRNINKDLSLEVDFAVKNELETKTALDKWLTERYCLYVNKDQDLYRYETHHAEWKVKQLEIKKLHLQYTFNDFNLSSKRPDMVHYSDGVKVLAWGKEKL